MWDEIRTQFCQGRVEAASVRSESISLMCFIPGGFGTTLARSKILEKSSMRRPEKIYGSTARRILQLKRFYIARTPVSSRSFVAIPLAMTSNHDEKLVILSWILSEPEDRIAENLDSSSTRNLHFIRKTTCEGTYKAFLLSLVNRHEAQKTLASMPHCNPLKAAISDQTLYHPGGSE